MNMAVKILGSSDTINDPLLPWRAQQQPQQAPQQSPDTISSTAPGQGPQYNPSFGADTSPVPMDPGIAAMLARAAAPQSQTQQQTPSPLTPNYRPSFPITGNYSPSPLDAPQSVKGNYLKPYLGNVDVRGAPYPATAGAARPSNTGPGGADMSGIFANLPDNTFDGARNAVQTAQAPAPATPQGWNLFTALGQALGHLLGFNAAGQPQGMSGLVRNPVQPAPAQTANSRMPTPVQQAARYQGRTLLG
jgi:hypothetical protein